ncbi:hypothetical protein BJ165DRAFT_1355474, partial [Panaeolus papilionaceus]
MDQALPKGIRTLEHSRTKNHSRPDNVFCTDHTSNRIIKCDVLPELRPVKTDHYPIGILLDISKNEAPQQPMRNFRMTDWQKFNASLIILLATESANDDIHHEAELDRAIERIAEAIQHATEENVPLSKLTKFTRRWWNKDLDTLRKEKQKLSWKHHKLSDQPDHPVHAEFR